MDERFSRTFAVAAPWIAAGMRAGAAGLLGWELAEVSRTRVRLKADLLASSRDMYHKDNAVAEGAPKP